MIIINNKKELTQNMKLKVVENTNKKGWVMQFDDDLTINCKVEFLGENKYDKVLIAKNITFKDENYIPWILADGDIFSEKELVADNIYAKNITSPYVDSNNILCDKIKTKKVHCLDKLYINKELDCDMVMTEHFSCFGKVRAKTFYCGDLALSNLTADNTEEK